jgi:predicted nucleic-acid-binding Zn-ribbon protein
MEEQISRLFGNTRRSQSDPNPGVFSLEGRPVSCPHCDGTQFEMGEAQLNTAFATLIELDWLNKTASILSCTTCGQIQWFGRPPTRDA